MHRRLLRLKNQRSAIDKVFPAHPVLFSAGTTGGFPRSKFEQLLHEQNFTKQNEEKPAIGKAREELISVVLWLL